MIAVERRVSRRPVAELLGNALSCRSVSIEYLQETFVRTKSEVYLWRVYLMRDVLRAEIVRRRSKWVGKSPSLNKVYTMATNLKSYTSCLNKTYDHC
jgi:hypothetical protein